MLRFFFRTRGSQRREVAARRADAEHAADRPDYPGPVTLLPRDPDLARETRPLDRLYDVYDSDPMQNIVFNRLRPADQKDAFGLAQAKASPLTSYGMHTRMRQRIRSGCANGRVRPTKVRPGYC